jgi:hypothetical protein
MYKKKREDAKDEEGGCRDNQKGHGRANLDKSQMLPAEAAATIAAAAALEAQEPG